MSRELPEDLSGRLAGTMEQLMLKLTAGDSSVLRSVCVATRAAYDQHAPSLRVRTEDHIHGLRSLLLRGCRPKKVILGGGDQQALEANACLRLLRPFTEVSMLAPLATVELQMPAACLRPDTARAAAGAFPRLTRLTLDGKEEPSEAAGAGLSLLLGMGSTAGAQLPALTELSLAGAAPPLVGALRGASQLSKLEIAAAIADAGTAGVLASLTGLRSLSLQSCDEALLPQLLAPLTALTALDLGTTRGRLPAPALRGMPSLATIAAGPATLDVSALQGLSRLTRLRVEALEAPALASAAPATATWQLPPKLADLQLGSQNPEVLSRLRTSPVWRLQRCNVALLLMAGRHINSRDGCLLPAAEDALCGAADFLSWRLNPNKSHVAVAARPQPRLGPVKPVGGEAGPGRRNHARWLRAFGATGMGGLILGGIALSHQDMATIAETCDSLKSLYCQRCGPPPLGALPLLSRLPHLELDVSAWCGPNRDGPLVVPLCAPGSLLALCGAPDFKGTVAVATVHLPRGDEAQHQQILERLRELVAAVHRELAALGLPQGRLVLA